MSRTAPNPSHRGGLIVTLLLLVACRAGGDSFKLDFNGATAQTASGFQAYSAQHEVPASFGARTYSAFGTNLTVTPTWTGTPATNTAQQAIVRGAANGYTTNAADLLDLVIDWIGTDQRENPGDPLTLTLSGLPGGTYGWLSYHHDTQDQQGRFSVTVNDAAGSATTSGLQISSTLAHGKTNLAQVTKFTTTLTSDGVNPITLVWEATDAPSFNTMFVMNGFEITNAIASAPQQTNAALRRPISPQQPMWLVHIDTWNYADPQKIIALIPEDLRPYVVLNLSLSISHDAATSRFQVAEYGYEIARSWLRACAENRMWAMIQPSSGGFSQFSDFDRSVYEEFFREYPNLIGFNYCEQFWGYDSPADPLSAKWSDRITHFANLLPLCSKYGGYLVVSWCGNQWSPPINPIGMWKQNPAFAAACRTFTENYILCEKYTQQSYLSDMESICLGAYLSGYSGQYGIRYDDTGWTDWSGTNNNFTMATAGAAHLEHIMLTGMTVIDGPELIWTQCFRETGRVGTTDGYTMRNWATYPQFDNVSVDLFRKVLDGTVRIPTRQEVINRTKYVVINNVNSGGVDTIYSSPDTLFEGLYRMDGDGNLRDNKTFFKKTGRYPTLPTVYLLDDALANTFAFPINRSAYASRWPTIAAKTNELNAVFPQEYTGDLYAGRHENGWVIYNPYKTNRTASGAIPFKYNSCSRVDLTLSQYTAGVMKEYSNSVSFYLGNYDNVLDLGLKTDTITIHGSTVEPTYTWADRGSHQPSSVTKSWTGGVFTLTVQHNGALDLTIQCAGTNTGRLTAFTPATLISPLPPMAYSGPLQYEAECFDYKNITDIVTGGYSGSVRNYSGQGYLRLGTSAAAAVRDAVTVRKGGAYRLQTRYSVTGADISTIDLWVNGVKVGTPLFTQTATLSDWAVNEQRINLNAGANTIEFRANGPAASSVHFDRIVVLPTVITDGIVIQENGPGFVGVDGTIDSTAAGFTGAGYAQVVATNGARVQWELDFDASAVKSFTFRYASTNGGTANLIIGGVNVAGALQFPATGALTNWHYATVYASTPAGTAPVQLQATAAAGLPAIDFLEVTGGWAGTPPPQELTAVAVARTQINLAWQASSNATSYHVKRALASGGDYTVVASGLTATQFQDTGLASGTAYFYVVSAVSALGEGLNSAEATATTFSGEMFKAVSSGHYTVTSGVGVPVATFDLDDSANVLVLGVYIDASNVSCLTNLTTFGGVRPTGLIQASGGGGNRLFGLYWLNPNTAPGQGLVIAATASANIGAGYFALQLSGVDTNAAVRRTGAATTDGGSVGITTTAANSFVVSFYSVNDPGVTLTPAAPLARLGLLNAINGAGGGTLAVATNTLVVPGIQTLAWTSSGVTSQHGVNGFAFAPLPEVIAPGGSRYLTNSYNPSTGVLSLSWPAGEGWRLQRQTNSLATGLGTNWVYVTDGTVSSTNVVVDPAVPASFFRLRYP